MENICKDFVFKCHTLIFAILKKIYALFIYFRVC
jgi:hypothetical protein